MKNHITSLLSKMGLQRRTQVAAWVAGQRAAAWRNRTQASSPAGMSTTGSGSDQPACFAVPDADSQESYERVSFASSWILLVVGKLQSKWFADKLHEVTFTSSSSTRTGNAVEAAHEKRRNLVCSLKSRWR